MIPFPLQHGGLGRMRRPVAAPAGSEDTFYDAVSLLVDGTQGALVDLSKYARTITNAGGVTITGSGGTGYLDFTNASNGYLTVAETADFGFGLGDYTLEVDVYRDTDTAEDDIFEFRKAADSTPRNLIFYISYSEDCIGTYDSSTVRGNTGSTILGGSGWKRVAWARRNGTTYGFIDGVLQWSYTTAQTFLSTRPLVIGANFSFGGLFDGRMRNLRITRGVGRWIANYTPSAFNTSAPAKVRWDDTSTYASSPLVLSNSNQRVSLTSSDSSIAKTVRGTKPKWAGKWYFEIYVNTIVSGTTTTSGAGVASEDLPWTTAGLATSTGTTNTRVALWPDSTGSTGRIYKGSSFVTGTGIAEMDAGRVLQFAVDLDNREIWVGVDGTWHNSGDPASRTNPTASGAEVPAGKAWYPACSPWAGACSFDLYSGATECAYSPPSGFSYW